MLEVRDIHTYYGYSYILQGVSFKLDRGTVVGIVGRNGVGKTTLIRSIIGLSPARRGEIIFKESNITHLPPNAIARRGVGLVPQGRRIFPSLTLRENLLVVTRKGVKGWPLERIYALFPLLKERQRQKAGRLSGGEQQILAVARALRCNPDLLLMDEPSEGLAPLLVKQLRELLQTLKAEGLSILLVEQNLNLALSVSDYMHVMNKGSLVYGSTPEGLTAAEEVKNKYLGV